MIVALLGSGVIYVRWLKIGGVKNPETNEGGEYISIRSPGATATSTSLALNCKPSLGLIENTAVTQ